MSTEHQSYFRKLQKVLNQCPPELAFQVSEEPGLNVVTRATGEVVGYITGTFTITPKNPEALVIVPRVEY